MALKQAPLIHRVADWAEHAPDVLGCLLLGDLARGQANDETIVQIVVLAVDPARWLQSRDWMKSLGHMTGAIPEERGLMRLFFESGEELELSIVNEGWAAVDPVDPLVSAFIHEGAQILFDPKGLLSLLVSRVDLRHRT